MARRPTPRAQELRLLIVPHINPARHTPSTLVILETAQSFASFAYELSVSETREGDMLSFRVLGLKAPSMSLPRAGRAQSVRTYDDLNGVTTVSVTGLDGRVDSCTVDIAPEGVRLLKPPASRWLAVITDPDHRKSSSTIE